MRIPGNTSLPVPATPTGRLAALAALCALVVGALAVLGGGGSEEASTAATTTTVTAPDAPEVVFGPVPDTGPGAVRIAGLTLPVTGGGPGAWDVLTPCARTTTVDGTHVAGAHVVIDPGHGGFETGAVGPTGVVEEELNLDVSRRVAERLRAEGATVVLTRDDDVRLSLRSRAALAVALDPLLFVSIHHNSGPTVSAEAPGTQVFHRDRDAEGRRAGGLIFAAIRDRLGPFAASWSEGNATGVRPRLTQAGEDFYGVLREAGDVPAVLVEAAYLSAEPEATLLTRDDVRDAEADAIATAIRDWVETDREGNGFGAALVAEESAGGGGGTEDCEDPPGL